MRYRSRDLEAVSWHRREMLDEGGVVSQWSTGALDLEAVLRNPAILALAQGGCMAREYSLLCFTTMSSTEEP